MVRDIMGDMVERREDLLADGMTVVEWFDPTKPDHMKAYKVLRETGQWPQGFIPEDLEFPGTWAVQLSEKVVQYLMKEGAYLEDFHVGDVVQVMDAEGNTTIIPRGTVDEVGTTEPTGVQSIHIKGEDDWFDVDKYDISVLVAAREGKAPLDSDPEDKKIQQLTEAPQDNPPLDPDADEPRPEDEEEEKPFVPAEEEPAVDVDLEKIYLGQAGDTHFYIVSDKNEAGVVEDLQITDQEGNTLVSAKEKGLDMGDVSKFILGAIEDEALKGAQLERSVVMQYLVPQIEDQLEEPEDEFGAEAGAGGEEKPPGEEPGEGEEEKPRPRPRESKVQEVSSEDGDYGVRFRYSRPDGRILVGFKYFTSDAARKRWADKFEQGDSFVEFIAWSNPQNESKEASGMLVEDNKGNSFSVELVDEGSAGETVVSINGREFRFQEAMVKVFAEGNKLTDESLKELALQTITHLDSSDYAELIGMGVQEAADYGAVGAQGAPVSPGLSSEEETNGPDEERIPGGADLLKPINVAPNEILAGMTYELEHADDPHTALEIALDHLAEDPEYYSAMMGGREEEPVGQEGAPPEAIPTESRKKKNEKCTKRRKPRVKENTVNEWIDKELMQRNEPLYKELVPVSGAADTFEGELLRAANRLAYRYFNDGDYFYEGYGTETAGPAHAFLMAHTSHVPGLDKALAEMYDARDDAYKAALEGVLAKVLDYVESREGNYTENAEDLLDYESEFQDEDDDEEYDRRNKEDYEPYYEVDDEMEEGSTRRRKSKMKEGKAPLDSDPEDKKIKQLTEGILELAGEVDWMTPEDVDAVRKAVEDGRIDAEWPPEEEMINALSELEDVVDPMTAGEEPDAVRTAYLRHILVPKAISTAEVGESEMEGKELHGEEDYFARLLLAQLRKQADRGEELSTEEQDLMRQLEQSHGEPEMEESKKMKEGQNGPVDKVACDLLRRMFEIFERDLDEGDLLWAAVEDMKDWGEGESEEYQDTAEQVDQKIQEYITKFRSILGASVEEGSTRRRKSKKMKEGEYSDMAGQSSFKKTFQVDYITDADEQKSTKVMAFDDKEAERMLTRQKGVKSVARVKMVKKAAETTEEAISEQFLRNGEKVLAKGEPGTIVGRLRHDEYKVLFADGEVGDYHTYDIKRVSSGSAGEKEAAREGKAPLDSDPEDKKIQEGVEPVRFPGSPAQWNSLLQWTTATDESTLASILVDDYKETLSQIRVSLDEFLDQWYDNYLEAYNQAAFDAPPVKEKDALLSYIGKIMVGAGAVEEGKAPLDSDPEDKKIQQLTEEEVGFYGWIKEEDRGGLLEDEYTGSIEDLPGAFQTLMDRSVEEFQADWDRQGWVAGETESGVKAIAKNPQLLKQAKRAAGRLWIKQEQEMLGLGDDEDEMEEDRRARLTAESLLGLQPKSDPVDEAAVGDSIQIVKRSNFEMVVEEAVVKQMDEKRGVEITGNSVPGKQVWYDPKHYVVIKL